MAPMVARSSTMPTNKPARPITRTMWLLTSDLHVDYFAQPEDPECQVHDEGNDERDADRVRPQHPDVVLAHKQHVEEEERRETAQDPRRQPALGGQHLHLTAQTFALPECRG